MDDQQTDKLLEELRAMRRELRISRIANICTAGLLLAVMLLLLGGREILYGVLWISGAAAVGVVLWRDRKARLSKPRPPARVVLPSSNF